MAEQKVEVREVKLRPVRITLDEAAVTALTSAMDAVSTFFETETWRGERVARVEALNDALGMQSFKLKKRLGDAKERG